MSKYITKEISELQLEDFVRRASENIEPGLKYLTSQKTTHQRGRLDVLFVDSGNALVLAELKVVEDDNMLWQGLDYYDYVTQDLSAFSRAYGRSESITIDTSQQARLLLIAPSFSTTLVNRCKWIEVPISLFRFKCIALEDKPEDTIVVYDEVPIPPRPKPIEIPTIDQHLSYITDPDVRTTVKELLKEIKSWEKDRILISAITNDISIKMGGKVITYLTTRRKHFVVSMYDEDGDWTSFPVKTGDELRDVTLRLQRRFEELKQQG